MKNWFRNIIRGLSFTSALFIFQACYGTPQDFEMSFLVEGQVKSKVSGLPIKGIQVSIVNDEQYELTDENGKFSFYTGQNDQVKIHFEDIDSTQNRLYASKDSLITEMADKIYLDIELNEK